MLPEFSSLPHLGSSEAAPDGSLRCRLDAGLIMLEQDVIRIHNLDPSNQARQSHRRRFQTFRPTGGAAGSPAPVACDFLSWDAAQCLGRWCPLYNERRTDLQGMGDRRIHVLTGSRTVASRATLLLGMFLASCVPPAAGQPSPPPMPSLPTDTRPPTAGPVADTATSVPPTGTPPPAEETAVVATWASSPADLSVIGPDNASDLQVLARLEGSLAFSPDLATFALKKKAGIALVEAQTLAEIALLPCEDSDRCDVFAFSPHGETLAWNPQAGVVRVWDVAARTMRAELGDLPETCCRELSYSPDGRLLAISTWPPVSLWDAATARELFSLDNAWQVFFAPDGKTLAFSLLNATAV